MIKVIGQRLLQVGYKGGENMKMMKDGNTTLIFNDSMAVRTDREIQAILDEAAEIVRRSLIEAEIEKQRLA